jgi:hypothetical protein
VKNIRHAVRNKKLLFDLMDVWHIYRFLTGKFYTTGKIRKGDRLTTALIHLKNLINRFLHSPVTPT